MKVLISLCFLLLVTLSNSKYGPPSWSRCPAGPNTWIPLYVQITQDPNNKDVLTISAAGVVENSGDYLDFQSLVVSGSIGTVYTWNSTSPYSYRIVGRGEYFALNYTTFLPSLNETYVQMTMHALGTNGNDLACINILLKNQTTISI